MIPRFRIRDDRELEQVAEIKPADHQFTAASPETIAAWEKRILGPSWYKPRKESDERS